MDEVLRIRVLIQELSDFPGTKWFVAVREDNSKIITIPELDIRAFAISLLSQLLQIHIEENCNFLVIDDIAGERREYEVCNLLRVNEDTLRADIKFLGNLPPARTISRTFYNWFSGKSGPKS